MVDCQEDFFARSGLEPERTALAAKIARLLGAARTKGWPIAHVHTRVSADGSDAMPHRRDPARREVVEGTPGALPIPEAAPREGEPVFIKHFFSAFDAPGLAEHLGKAAPGPLLIAGVHSHACIRESATDAYAAGHDVVIVSDAVGSDDPAHGRSALAWLDGRAARMATIDEVVGTGSGPLAHHDPCDRARVLFDLEDDDAPTIARKVAALRDTQADWAGLSIEERKRRLAGGIETIEAARDALIALLVEDLGKPIADAEGEFGYGQRLSRHVIDTAEDRELAGIAEVAYRPHGLVGLITPWNNPFAIPLAKLLAALVYGNSAIWKPAPPALRLSRRMAELLRASRAPFELVAGDAQAGRIIAREVDALSFTGSDRVGRQLAAEGAARGMPVQAEMGGSNAAIIDRDADLDAAAHDLAVAMFSYAGQRCTAIRRLIVHEDVASAFSTKLAAAMERLKVGRPEERETQLGPMIDPASRRRIEGALQEARDAGARLTRSSLSDGHDGGCWLAPTLVEGLAGDHPLGLREWFGPIAFLSTFATFDEALALHDAGPFGLVGVYYGFNEAARERFLAQAQAGMLSLGEARPAFDPAAPFCGWGHSGWGPPEHGRWDRDFFTRPQARYGR
nr:aldehyde dehydrogenase family protein [Sphingomicrobium nitratireducens]